MKLNQYIKARRLELNLTLEDVGKACGVGKSTVRKWETGMIKNMKVNNAAALARVLDIDPLDLLKDDVDGKSEEAPVWFLEGITV